VLTPPPLWNPNIPPSVLVVPGATVVGDVTLGEQASVWFGAVVRGDSSFMARAGAMMSPIIRRTGVRAGIEDPT